MNLMYIVAFLCVLGVVSSSDYEEYDEDDHQGHGHHEGQWQGEGHADSQWHGEGHDASQWHKEGLAESQDHGDQGGYHKYGPAPLGHDGRVVDTDEVAHAKSFHHAAHAAASHGGHGGDGGYGGHGGNGHGSYAPESHNGQYNQGKWHGPLAHIELTHDGKYVKDTPEVAHARAQHFAALSAASHGNGYHGGHHGHQGKW